MSANHRDSCVRKFGDHQRARNHAHRGASHHAPENTIAAFQLAWTQESDGIEGDFQLTKDGQIVCLHDKTTQRTAADQPELLVAESTLAELRKIDVGRWKGNLFKGERIPTLQEVIDTVPRGRKLFIEVKCGVEIIPQLKPSIVSIKSTG